MSETSITYNSTYNSFNDKMYLSPDQADRGIMIQRIESRLNPNHPYVFYDRTFIKKLDGESANLSSTSMYGGLQMLDNSSFSCNYVTVKYNFADATVFSLRLRILARNIIIPS